MPGIRDSSNVPFDFVSVPTLLRANKGAGADLIGDAAVVAAEIDLSRSVTALGNVLTIIPQVKSGSGTISVVVMAMLDGYPAWADLTGTVNLNSGRMNKITGLYAGKLRLLFTVGSGTVYDIYVGYTDMNIN